jgi:replicative DNA helicase
MKQEYGVKLIVIDYLQLLCSTDRKNENRRQEIGDISRGVKSLAKELRVPVIILSQMNREIEKEKRKPRLSDLYESSQIESDSDLVGLLYRPNAGEEDESALELQVNLLIAKQRNGPTGDVGLTFFRQYTRFESMAKVAKEDYPNQE